MADPSKANAPRSFDPESVEDWKAWAAFLSIYVDFHHGKGISDRAWDCFMNGDGPYA